MFNLYRKEIGLLAVLCCLSFGVFAQEYDRQSRNFLEFINKRYYFGLALGYNSTRYKILHSDEFILNDSFLVNDSKVSPGFNVGIITNMKLGNNLDLRFIPTFTFGDRTLSYLKTDGSTFDQKLETVYTELPVIVRYKSRPYKDMRVYVLAGIKYGFDVSNNARDRVSEAKVRLTKSDFSAEYGVGFQFFMPYFIFSPELKISHSLSNNLQYDPNSSYATVIEKLLTRSITLSFQFEG